VGRLDSGPRVVGRLGSAVWASASFQMLALTAGGDVLGGKGNCPAGEYVRGGNVPHSSILKVSKRLQLEPVSRGAVAKLRTVYKHLYTVTK